MTDQDVWFKVFDSNGAEMLEWNWWTDVDSGALQISADNTISFGVDYYGTNLTAPNGTYTIEVYNLNNREIGRYEILVNFDDAVHGGALRRTAQSVSKTLGSYTADDGIHYTEKRAKYVLTGMTVQDRFLDVLTDNSFAESEFLFWWRDQDNNGALIIDENGNIVFELFYCVPTDQLTGVETLVGTYHIFVFGADSGRRIGFYEIVISSDDKFLEANY